MREILETEVGCPVSSFNEWDPLEEVVVGTMEGATVPGWNPVVASSVPESAEEMFRAMEGAPFPSDQIASAERNLAELARILEKEGVRVARPQPTTYAVPFATPNWAVKGGLYSAMPRDCLLVVGETIIEAPMAWRSRYFEVFAYRSLLADYFKRGANWIAAPKPQLKDESFDPDFEESIAPGQPFRSVLREVEPLFDAADFFRCGEDIFYFRSHTTNALGVQWLQRALGAPFRFHELDCADDYRMHIDTTFLPLAPGKLLVNPERVLHIPKEFHEWEVLKAPPPASHPDAILHFSGPWLSMNLLMLDPVRCIVAGHEKPLIEALKRWGFEPIPCDFSSFYAFGGSVHCATLDVRRRGKLQSYF